MTIDDVEAFLPWNKNPVSVDDYADYMMSVAACGTYEQSLAMPSLFQYTNPQSGTKISFVAELNRNN